MKHFDANLTRENIFKCISYSGLTDENFANIIGISLRKFQYIKAKKFEFTIKDIEKACTFFKIPFDKITTTSIVLLNNYRESLLDYHIDKLEFKKILQDKPSISFAIEFILIHDSSFLDIKLEIKNIKAILDKYGYSYTSSSLTNELKKSKFINFEPHPLKKGTFIYSKK
ncbi:hypothetical protein AY601_2947 [Pedobacter cryoconitis]|uniref:Uncharacterized protein n=1 Tax=Pedobacter cryoconitis TaxID=188932 RepID=A0A127VF24_9SPHI|nr:hypothetical protein [Pedobacter cryoconitis]AMP99821.1 hypothetical protein AY601_2947 [Pedobacter cryoconitis]